MKALFVEADETLVNIALSFCDPEEREFFWSEQAHRLLSPAALSKVSMRRFPLKHRQEWARLLSSARDQAAQWDDSVVPAIRKGTRPPSFETFVAVALYCKFVELTWAAEDKVRSARIPEHFPDILCHAFYLDRLLASDRYLQLRLGASIVTASAQLVWPCYCEIMARLIAEANLAFSEEIGDHDLDSASRTAAFIMQWTHHLLQSCRWCGRPIVRPWAIRDSEGKLFKDKLVIVATMPEDTKPISAGRSGATEKYCGDECRKRAKRVMDGEAKKRERQRKREQQK
jgi:hypothetical protein